MLQHKPPRHQNQIVYSTMQQQQLQQQQRPASVQPPTMHQLAMDNNKSLYATVNRNSLQQQQYGQMMGSQSPMTVVRKTRDGRSTPLVLQRVPHQQTPVRKMLAPGYFRPIQIQNETDAYRPYAVYESESGGSEAGEIQRILFNRRNGELLIRTYSLF